MSPLLVPNGISEADRFVTPDGTVLTSLAMINQLPDDERERIYRALIYDGMLDRFGIDRETLRNPQGERVVQIDASPRIGAVEIKIRRQLSDRDPVLYFQLADTANNQIVVLLFVINDPDSPRFNVDRDWGGEPTKFGTLSRNVEEEVKAMQAGLAPGQVRRGLKMARRSLPVLESFVARLSHDMFFLEPLGYHAAILFERYGCNYSLGRKKMETIHHEFQPSGELFKRLDGSSPFRMPGAEKTVRGRSWAIQDGILGEPFTDIHMYKRIGVEAGIETFPNAAW
jgi:hypothetical protein